MSVAEREDAPSGGTGPALKPDKSPNYLSLDKEDVENAWINEFLAPFQGIKNVREAHGNRAAAELAVQICAECPELPKPVALSAAAPQSAASQSPAASEATSVSRSPQTQTAAPLEKAKNESVSQSTPIEASEKNPYFAHLAMCAEGDPPPVQPPLGWVLSNATQKAFGKLLTQCGNDHELSQLEIAFGRQMR